MDLTKFKIILISLFLFFLPIKGESLENEEPSRATSVITVAAVGDIMMGTDYPSPKLPGRDGKLLFEESKDFLRQADIVFGNLEGPLCDGGSPAKKAKDKESYVFRTPTRFVKNLVEAGFNGAWISLGRPAQAGPRAWSGTRRRLPRGLRRHPWGPSWP